MSRERERKSIIDTCTAGTIAANLLREGGATGGNPLAERPEVKVILEDLKDIPRKQIEDVLNFLSDRHSEQ